MVQLAYYQQKLKQSYDANVKLRPLAPSDLVLRKVVSTAKNPAWGKLWPNWEGPNWPNLYKNYRYIYICGGQRLELLCWASSLIY